jgi:hypothetical protein
MRFELMPTIDTMIDLYGKPLTIERFNEYIKLLQGDTKGDLVFPISGFNPMAKEYLLGKLFELKKIDAEKIMAETLSELNAENGVEHADVFKVALNLSDDLKGGWTNRYTSDYDNKFRINALSARKFCISVFWSSEDYSAELIRERTLEYAYRTIYRQTNPRPLTLEQHLDQEKFVVAHVKYNSLFSISDCKSIDNFYNSHKHSDNYSLIFNFFYGNKASASLSFPLFGLESETTGFEFAKSQVIK